MIDRHLNPLQSKSYFLFGPRGAGKSTFISRRYLPKESLVFDLLDPELVHELSLHPNNFREQILASNKKVILVDEIQKIPKLLDLVHWLIVNEKRKFVLTGSSARRLKQKGVNLLAGRALTYYLYPFSAAEIKKDFNLEKALTRGLLPESYFADSDEEAKEYLKSYCLNYLEREIQQEQWVRKLDPFRRFLEIAAQSSGKVVNYSRISKDVGVDDSTVASYFEILVDTMMGKFLPSYHRSVRKQQRIAPKFYLIDPGIVRALNNLLSVPLLRQTSSYGDLFEQFIFLELVKFIEYQRLDWKVFYLRTRDDVEIDLVIERPGKPLLLIEVKSKDTVSSSDTRALLTLGKDLDSNAEMYLLSNDPRAKQIDKVKAVYWRDFFEAEH